MKINKKEAWNGPFLKKKKEIKMSLTYVIVCFGLREWREREKGREMKV